MGIDRFVDGISKLLGEKKETKTEPDVPRERIPPAPILYRDSQGQFLTSLVFNNVKNPFDIEMLKFGKNSKKDKWETPEGQEWNDLKSALFANPVKIFDLKKDGISGGTHEESPSSVLIHVSENVFKCIDSDPILRKQIILAQHELQEWHAKFGPLYMGRSKPRYAFLPTPNLPDDRIVVKFGTTVYLPDEGEFPFGDICYEVDGVFKALDGLPMNQRVGMKEGLESRNVAVPLGLYEKQGVAIVAHRLEHSTLPLEKWLPSAWEGGLAISMDKWNSVLQGTGELKDIFWEGKDNKTILQGVEKKDDLIIVTLATGADEGGLGGGNTFRIALRHPSQYAPKQTKKAEDTVSEKVGEAPKENRVPADADQRTRLRRETICFDNLRQGQAPQIRIQAEETNALRLVAAGIGLRKLPPKYGLQEWRMAFDKDGMPTSLNDTQQTLRLRSTAGASSVFWQAPGINENPVGALPANLSWGGKAISVYQVPGDPNDPKLRELFYGYISLTNGLTFGVGQEWNWVGRAKFGYFSSDGSLLVTGGEAADLDSFGLSRFHAAFRMVGGGKVEVRQQSTSQPIFICRKNGKVEQLDKETGISNELVNDNEELYVEKGEYDIREGKAAVIEPGDTIVLGSYFFKLEN